MDTVHECDRQTDRRTDGQTDRITITKTVQRRASHGKNASKILKIVRKLRCFVHFPYFSLTVFRVVDWGAWPQYPSLATPLKLVMFYLKIVFVTLMRIKFNFCLKVVKPQHSHAEIAESLA